MRNSVISHSSLASLGAEERFSGVYYVQRMVKTWCFGMRVWEMALSDHTGSMLAYALPAALGFERPLPARTVVQIECVTLLVNGRLIAEIRSLDRLAHGEFGYCGFDTGAMGPG